ncbi:MAG: glycosyltransferase [Clostridiales bacterium]|jgi:cellulose synthase/poly-beta-1,6-N-acetylglucosamine synthase-like glycosyltransferase|nr:glycosyltransferase [Clostridiales bacterium]MDU6974677.1 glycosyltransferase [Clostridiales bacterium]
MNIIDYLFIISLIMMWIVIFVNILLVIGGYRYSHEMEETIIDTHLEEYPFVSIMVPAHNEGIVIEKTVRSLLSLDYPAERYEVIIINDNSSDNSAQILKGIQDENPAVTLKVINTDAVTGGKGKSNALNIGFNISKGEYLAIYDADNTPEKKALKYLVVTLSRSEDLGAVIGKFRTRNKSYNLLTRFINIETLFFQWMAQAGRWKLFKLCTIPGTNFLIRRSIIEEIGGWDTKALAEDTEISFRIYRMGYKIMFMPKAVTWEQEPQTFKVWFKQRTRWVKGNIYVIFKDIKYLFDLKSGPIKFDIIYFTSIYLFGLTASIISDVLFILGLTQLITVNVVGYSLILWILAYIVYGLSIAITLIIEKGEFDLINIGIAMLMYFTYSKMWSVVAMVGFYHYIKDSILKKEAKWYKTERF